MNSRPWLRNVRLFCGFLLAPALVPLTLHAALKLVVANLGLDLGEVSASTLRVFVLTFGVGMVYLGALCFGVPYVLFLQRAGRLKFRTILLPTLMLSWVYSVVVYASLVADYPFARTVAVLCGPGVILAGLSFYFIAVWKSPEDETPISLLLEAYSGRQKPRLQM